METDEAIVVSAEESEHRLKSSQLAYSQKCRARAAVVRSKLVRSYEIVESISTECLGDTAFRDKLRGILEYTASSLDDFLLSDSYWEERIKSCRELAL